MLIVGSHTWTLKWPDFKHTLYLRDSNVFPDKQQLFLYEQIDLFFNEAVFDVRWKTDILCN
jgi:hypothetical protein